MNKVTEVSVPLGSSIWRILPSFGFSDAYQVELSRPDLSPEDIYEAVFNYPPAWVIGLFVVRGWFACALNLKHLPVRFGARASDSRPFEVGRRAGLFTVQYTDPYELILGEQDSHLDFWLSVYKSKEHGVEVATISTAVLMHNRIGKAYMKVVEPFHRVLAKMMVQRAIQAGRL